MRPSGRHGQGFGLGPCLAPAFCTLNYDMCGCSQASALFAACGMCASAHVHAAHAYTHTAVRVCFDVVGGHDSTLDQVFSLLFGKGLRSLSMRRGVRVHGAGGCHLDRIVICAAPRGQQTLARRSSPSRAGLMAALRAVLPGCAAVHVPHLHLHILCNDLGTYIGRYRRHRCARAAGSASGRS